MTPRELARANAEHSHQRALFAWANMAAMYGFDAAWDELAYKIKGHAERTYGQSKAIVVLKRLHAIPNGGQRDKITAGKLKAEGVKRGVPDICLPLPIVVRGKPVPPPLHAATFEVLYCGLHIEMKRPKAGKQAAGSASDEQNDWIAYLRSVGYAVSVCFDWITAARDIQSYIEAGGISGVQSYQCADA